MDFTFHNVTITVTADSAEAAYGILCQVLDGGDIEYITDTFTKSGEDDNHDTSEVWPCECGRPKYLCKTLEDPEAEHGDV